MRTSFLWLVAAALCACRGVDVTGQRSEGFAAPDRSMVYEGAWNALRQQGFIPDSSASSETEGYITTRYRMELQPFSGRGFREKATVRVHEVPQKASYYTVEVNVLREYNDNLSQPSSPIVADWRSAERMPDVENLIKSRVEMMFIAPDVSPEFRATHGMNTQPAKNRLPGMRTGGPDVPEGGKYGGR